MREIAIRICVLKGEPHAGGQRFAPKQLMVTTQGGAETIWGLTICIRPDIESYINISAFKRTHGSMLTLATDINGLSGLSVVKSINVAYCGKRDPGSSLKCNT